LKPVLTKRRRRRKKGSILFKMNHPTTRLLTVLELLQAYPTLSGAELARRLEINRRTLRRYIEMLQDLGIPIEAERGRYGGYRLQPGYRLPALMFNDEEALALTLGMLTVRQYGLSATPLALEGVLAKLARVLPEALRRQVQALEQTLTFYPTTTGAAQPPASPTLKLLSQATHQGQRVWLRYKGREGILSERSFDCYGLVCQDGRWYSVGYCHLRQDIRMFRLDRVLEVNLEEASFNPPANFDCADFVVKALATTPYTWSVEVLLETTLEEARQRVPAVVALLEEAAEGVVLKAQVERLEGMAQLLVGLGYPFVVREPAELRQVLLELAQRVTGWAERST
jgi:predicted DNA-binding transcriptional regulator YafY